MDPRLEIKLDTTAPKCATCGHYGGNASAETCSKHQVKVLNLAVCTDWNERIELEAIE